MAAAFNIRRVQVTARRTERVRAIGTPCFEETVHTASLPDQQGALRKYNLPQYFRKTPRDSFAGGFLVGLDDVEAVFTFSVRSRLIFSRRSVSGLLALSVLDSTSSSRHGPPRKSTVRSANRSCESSFLGRRRFVRHPIVGQVIRHAFVRRQRLQGKAEVIRPVVAAHRGTIGIDAAETIIAQMRTWHAHRLAQRADIRRNAACPTAKTGDAITHLGC